MSGEERRKSPRYHVEVPVRVTAEGVSFPGNLKDICRDAALLEVHRPCALDAQVALAMELPGTGGPMVVTGRVIRVAPGEGDARAMAILFGDLSSAAGARIDFFVATQEEGKSS